MDRIRHLLGFRTGPELAQYLKTKQPQISRWRNAGFAKSIAKLFSQAFNKPGDPRSGEYKAGVRAALRFRFALEHLKHLKEGTNK
jgi:hypothetical protein